MSKNREYSYQERLDLKEIVDKECKFNGRKCFLVGLKNQFATITDNKGRCVEYSWFTVETTAKGNKKFQY